MSAETDYRATALELTKCEERLSSLREEARRLEEEAGAHLAAVAASVAAGGPDAERRAPRATAERAKARLEEVRLAIPIVAKEVDELKERAAPLRLRAAEEAADAEEAVWAEKRVSVREMVIEFIHRFLPVYNGCNAAYCAAQEARREALRLAGAHPEEVYRAELHVRVPPSSMEVGGVVEALARAGGSAHALGKVQLQLARSEPPRPSPFAPPPPRRPEPLEAKY